MSDQPDESFERKLRPIYDALDSRNWKTALKLASAALQKYKGNQLLRSLKALSLHIGGREQEAQQLCDGIAPEVPTDDHILHTLSLVYKGQGRTKELTALHEAASNKEPKNVDLLKGLFSAYVRQFDYVKQQQAALKLVRSCPECDRYMWWAIVAMVLQARGAMQGLPTAMPQAQLMTLVESMAAKQVKKSGLESFEGLLLYCDILQSGGRLSEALEVVVGHLGDVIPMEMERQHLKGRLLEATGNAAASASIFRQTLLDNPDEWCAVLCYIHNAMPASRQVAMESPEPLIFVNGGLSQLLQRKASSSTTNCSTPANQDPDPGVASQLDSVQQTLDQLPEAASQNSFLSALASRQGVRAPALAQLELHYRKWHLKFSSSREFAEALMACVVQFGHLSSCAVDVRRYTAAVGVEDADWLCSALHDQCGEVYHESPQGSTSSSGGDNNPSGGGNSIVRTRLASMATAYQVEHDLSRPHFRNVDDALSYVSRVMELYLESRKMTQGANEHDRGPADDVITLVPHALLALHRIESQPQQSPWRLVQALLLLECAAVQQPSNAAIRLAACALCSLLGSPRHAAVHFYSLDIKHILHETLSAHHLLPVLMACLADHQMTDLLYSILELHSDHLRDAGDTLMMAYRRGTYSKVIEFVDFKERLDYSYNRALARVEMVVHDLRNEAKEGLAAAQVSSLQAAVALQEQPSLLEEGVLERLRFNDDLCTRPPWYPPATCSPHLAAVQWWEECTHQPNTGYARCWWSRTHCAEDDSIEASVQRRQKLRQCIHRRWLLPSLLHVSLLPSTSLAVSPATSAETLETAERNIHAYAESLGVSLEMMSPTLPFAGRSLVEQCELLTLAILSSGLGMARLHSCLQGDAASCEPNSVLPLVQTACTRLLVLESAFTSLCERTVTGVESCEASFPLVPMQYLAVQSIVVSEGALWLGLCLQSWSRHMRHGKKKKGKKQGETQTAVGGDPDSVVAPVLEAARKLLNSFTGGLTQIQNALAGHAEMLTTSQIDSFLQQVCGMQPGVQGTNGSLSQALWGFEPKFDAHAVLQSLVGSHADTARHIITTIKSRLDLVASVHF